MKQLDWTAQTAVALLLSLCACLRSGDLAAQPGVFPGSVNFGPVPVGSSSTSEFVQLRNNTGSALAITQIAAVSSPFQLVSSNCAPLPITLQPLGLCTLEYRFSPTVAGPASTNVAVNWQAGPGNTGTVFIPLSGSGVGPVLSISPRPLDFGAVRVGTSTAPQSVTLANTGQGTLDIQQIQTPPVPFSIASAGCPQPPFSLAAGTSCTLDFQFMPTATGVFSAQPGVTSSTIGSVNSIELSGSGVAPAILLSPTLIDFGAIGIGANSQRLLQIINPGQVPLSVAGISAGTPLLPQFSLMPGSCGIPPFQVPPGGAFCDVLMSFTPTATGPVQQQISFDSDAFSGSPNFTLQGSGLDLFISVTPMLTDFGSLLQGQVSPPETVRVENTGGDPIDLAFSFPVLPLNNPFLLQPGSCSDPITLPPGAHCDLIWVFAPTQSGTFDLLGRVTSGAATSPDEFMLTGIGLSELLFADGFE